MIRCAVFDLDGTLLASQGCWTRATTEYLALFGKTPDPDLHTILYTTNLEQAADHIIERYGIPATQKEVCEGIDGNAYRYYDTEYPLSAGVPELLGELRARGIRLTVATVTDRPCVEAALRHNGVLELFDGIVTTREAGAEKDRPDVYLQAAALGGGTAETSVVFEDAIHGIETAERAGFRTLGYCTKPELFDRFCEISTLTVRDFRELKGEKLNLLLENGSIIEKGGE